MQQIVETNEWMKAFVVYGRIRFILSHHLHYTGHKLFEAL